MSAPTRGPLLAVLCNPSMTSGARTLARVQLASELLSFDDVVVANLFSLPSKSTRDIQQLGQLADPWIAARWPLVKQLERAGAVLLAYGLERPSGLAGEWHRAQVVWLSEIISARELPQFWVGGGPRHPSRWQRRTSRRWPGMAFRDAVALELTPAPHALSPGRAVEVHLI